MRLWTMLVWRGVVAAALLAAAGPASAATVSAADNGSSGAVRFTAAPGEQNRVAVEPAEVSRPFFNGWYYSATYVIRDAGARVTAGAGCRQIDPHSVTCGREQIYYDLTVSLSDGDDVAVVGDSLPLDWTRWVTLLGADGDDRLALKQLLDKNMFWRGKIDAGNGNDVIDAMNLVRDSVVCGAGTDIPTFDVARVENRGWSDGVASDCELRR